VLKHVVDWGRTSAAPGEYDGSICVAAAMPTITTAIATITVKVLLVGALFNVSSPYTIEDYTKRVSVWRQIDWV